MSYCRWSSDYFQSDVYVYEDVSGGWTTHIAENKLVFKEDLPAEVPLFEKGREKEWPDRHEKVNRMVAEAARKDIGLPHDGKTFNHSTPKASAEFLMELKALGYYVPQYAIDSLMEESD